MELRTLGRTGLKVSDLSLGTMMFGGWGNPDHDACIAMVHAALDAGVNLVDTADVYADGESEVIVGKALKGRRDEVVLATKFWNPMGGGPNQRGASRRWIMQAVEGSLRRLGTDWIDLYQVHRPDPDTDPDELLGALSDLVRQGKVRYIGTSTYPADLLVELQWVAERRGHQRVVSEQPPYSIFTRGIEASVLPACRRHGMGVIAWAPLNGGWLTGKYRRGAPPPEGSRGSRPSPYFDPTHEAKLDAVEQLVALADEAGMSLTHLALAWVLEHPAMTSAIVGVKAMEQLQDVLSLGSRRLPVEVLDRIDEVVPPGTNLDPRNAGWVPFGLAREARRAR